MKPSRGDSEALSIMQNLLGRVSYKPNARFEANLHPSTAHHGYLIQISLFLTVPAVDNTTDEVTLQSSWECSSDQVLGQTEHFRMLMIQKLIRQMEMHEMDEWLKLDGVCVRDPHPERKAVA